MLNREQSQSGAAMPMVLIVIAVITVLGFTAAYVVDSQTQMLSRFKDREAALYAAEAGMEEYLYNLKINPNFYSDYEGLAFTGPSDQPATHDVHFAGLHVGSYTVTVDSSSIDNVIIGNASTLKDKTVLITVTGWTASNPDIKRQVQTVALRDDLTQQASGFQHPIARPGQPGNDLAGIIDKQIGKLHDLANNPNYNSYYFQGRTCLYFEDNQFTVVSNWNGSGWGAKGTYNTFPIEKSDRSLIIYVDGETDYQEHQDDYSYWGHHEDPHKWSPYYANVFISGTVKGNVTIYAKNNIYITAMDPTSDFDYANPFPAGIYVKEPDTGALGLVAGGAVQIIHGNWPDNDPQDVLNGRWYKAPPDTNPDQPMDPVNLTLDGVVDDQSIPITNVYDTSKNGFNIDAAVMALHGNLGLELYRSYPTDGRSMSKLIFNGCVFQSDPDTWDNGGGKLYDASLPFIDPLSNTTSYSGYYPIRAALNPGLSYPQRNSVYHNFYFPGATWTIKSWTVLN